MTNQTKQYSQITNTSKVTISETWNSILTTWATETETWDGILSFINNQSKEVFSILWSGTVYPWQLTLPWQSLGGISNQTRP